MPAADRSTEPARGPKTICIPCSPEPEERIVDDPERFPEFLVRQVEAAPELVPPESRPGDRRKDLYTCPKTGGKLRRIDLRHDESSRVRPSFLRPSLTGCVADRQAPLCSASSPSRSGP